MEAVKVVKGGVTALRRADVDTDQIIPKQFLKRIERTGFGEFLFYDWAQEPGWSLPEEPDPGHRAELRLRLERASTHPWALQDYGFQAIVAESFADIFFSNCTKIGLLPVAIPDEDVRALMDAGEGEIDLEALRGALRRARRAVRARRGPPPPAAQRPRRHRPHAAEGRRHHRLRARARAPRTRHPESLMPTIALLPGDGIGPEVTAEAVQVLDAVAEDLTFETHLAGGAAIDAHGIALTDEALAACQASDAVLLGAVGGPKWDTNESGAVRPEQALFRLRAELGLYANLRPVKPLTALYDASPLKRELIEGVDLLVVRELTGGLYYGERGTSDGRAFDTMVYTVAEIERIARTAFQAAKSRVTSVDKANVLDTSRLWREVVTRIHAEEFPNIELEHLLVDAAAMRLVAAPRHFEVIVTENMFGDILSDEASMLTGLAGHAAERLARRRRARPVRARARHGAGHRRPGDRQPARHDPLRRAAAAPRTRPGGRGGCRRIGR